VNCHARRVGREQTVVWRGECQTAWLTTGHTLLSHTSPAPWSTVRNQNMTYCVHTIQVTWEYRCAETPLCSGPFPKHGLHWGLKLYMMSTLFFNNCAFHNDC
jgi:hypothetical protein